MISRTPRNMAVMPSELDTPTGPPMRLRELMDLTGWSRPTLLAEMDRGRLKGFRVLNRQGSPWLFERAAVMAWWRSVTNAR